VKRYILLVVLCELSTFRVECMFLSNTTYFIWWYRCIYITT